MKRTISSCLINFYLKALRQTVLRQHNDKWLFFIFDFKGKCDVDFLGVNSLRLT